MSCIKPKISRIQRTQQWQILSHTLFCSSNVKKQLKTNKTKQKARTCKTESETQRSSAALSPRCPYRLHPGCTEVMYSLNSPRFPWPEKLRIRRIRWRTAMDTTVSSCPTLQKQLMGSKGFLWISSHQLPSKAVTCKLSAAYSVVCVLFCFSSA